MSNPRMIKVFSIPGCRAFMWRAKYCCMVSVAMRAAYFCKETNSRTDFFENLLSDQFLLTGKLEVFQKITQLLYGECCYLINIFISNCDSK